MTKSRQPANVTGNGDKLDTVALDELARSLAPLMIKHLATKISSEGVYLDKQVFNAS